MSHWADGKIASLTKLSVLALAAKSAMNLCIFLTFHLVFGGCDFGLAISLTRFIHLLEGKTKDGFEIQLV